MPKLKANPVAQRKRDNRERMRSAGFVLKQIWVKPADWPRVKRYINAPFLRQVRGEERSDG